MFYEELARRLADERAESVERELRQRQLVRQAEAAGRARRIPLRIAVGRRLIALGEWLAMTPEHRHSMRQLEPGEGSNSA